MLRLALAPTLLASTCLSDLVPGFRPPCAPLNVVSPYQSVWSCTDNLYDSVPQHWSGSAVELFGAVRVDSETYRFMGRSDHVPTAAKQLSLTVAPATTTYQFLAGGVVLTVRFSSPVIDLDGDTVLASRPVTDVTFSAASHDGKAHAVEVYYDNTAEGSVHDPMEIVRFERLQSPMEAGKLTIMQVGTVEQKVLMQGSDHINWGHWLLSTPKDAPGLHTVMAPADACRGAFAKGEYAGMSDNATGAVAAWVGWRVTSLAWSLGQVRHSHGASRHLTLAYDQVFSQSFFGTKMAPLWRRRWQDAASMLESVEASRVDDQHRIRKFDYDLVQQLTARGGSKFATIASLVYRQVLAGTQAVHNHLTGEEWVFLKEISSDGDVSTVDVMYPALPMFQYLYPGYFRKMVIPLMVYGNNETKRYGWDIPYNLPWAPHHLGHWPVCDLLPEAQEQMPVEESSNMLIMLAALHRSLKDLSYLEKYWKMLDGWADYVVASLPDPGYQLCTDDFLGASPHNVNLAAKGIVGLMAYGELVEARGDTVKAAAYRAKAADFVKFWVDRANDGDHFRMQFDLQGSWSLKYNLFYQKSLKLPGFPESVLQKESAYYQTKRSRCGVPLDNRHPYTKTDWSMWSALLGTREQFESFVDGLYTFADTTPTRLPLSDYYHVETCAWEGFRARPVQGGLYAPMVVDDFGEARSTDSKFV